MKFFSVLLATFLLLAGCGSSDEEKKDEKESKNRISLTETNTLQDKIEFKIDAISTTEKITPTITSGVHLFYEPKIEGNVLLDVFADVKNISEKAITVQDAATVTFKINGNDYTAQIVPESNDRKTLEYANTATIEPLVTKRIHYFAEVPKADVAKKVTMTANINGTKYDTSFVVADVQPEKKELSVGENITVDDYAEIKIENLAFTNKVEPSNPTSYYTYYEVKDDSKTYLVLTVNVKNLKSSALSADEVMNMKAVFDEKYEYGSFSTVEEDGGGDLSYSNITDIQPLTSHRMYYICEVPKEVTDKMVEVQLNINGQKYYLYK